MQLTRISRAVNSLLAGSSLLLAGSTLAQSTTVDDTVKTTLKTGATAVSVANPSHFDGDLRNIKPVDKWQPGDPIKIANPRHISDIQTILPAVNKVNGKDPLVAKQLQASKKKAALKSTSIIEVNIDGLEFNGVNPPDPSGDIGLKYYIQSINSPSGSSFNIYDKKDGSLVVGPLSMADLQTGDCATTLGDPIVLFDEQANRWLLTEFSTTSTKKLCVLVSKTEDPVSGGWYAYEFQAPDFPDYPKYSQIGGVYYASANESATRVYAFEREKMLKGEAAAMVRQDISRLAGFGFNSITPIDVDGSQDAPDGTPGLFIRHRDDELHNSGSNNADKDFLEIWSLTPDFSNPDNSKLEGPFNIDIAEIDSNFDCNSGDFGCLEQKDHAQTLDPLREVVMYKAQYRRFDAHESIVGNLITKIEGNVAAIRWFELRRSGGSDWALHQEGTYTEGDNVSRYMGGIAMDGDGNIALAYMMTGKTKYPSIGFNGRLAGDEAGTLSFGEQILIDGTSPIASDRNGDYSQMGIDPQDHCTFWFTSEYGHEGGRWGTRISSFKVPSCGDPNPGFTLSATNLTQEVCANGDMAPMVISASGYNEFAGDIALTYSGLPDGVSGSFTADTIKTGVETTANVTIAEGTAAGDYTFDIKGNSEGATERMVSAKLKLVDRTAVVAPQEPLNEATAVSLQPTLSWSSDRDASYLVEIATDEGFTNVVIQSNVSGGNNYRPSIMLDQETTYYWRVTGANSCGEQASAVFKFTTRNEKDGSTELKKDIPSDKFSGETDSYTSFYIDIPEGSSDLNFTLTGDNGDADIYVSHGIRPESGGNILCAGREFGSEEVCPIPGDLESGSYFVLIHAYEAYTDIVVSATYSGGFGITGQKPLEMDEEGSLEIQLSDLTASDDAYPEGFTLTVAAGENYSAEGNTITPATDFTGELSVNVSVESAATGSAQYQVKVQVNNVNDAPVVSAAQDASVEEDQSFTIELSHLTVSDVDTDAANLSVKVADGSNYSVSNDNVVTPTENFNGTLDVNVKVSDGEAESAAAVLKLTVTGVNDAPTLVNDSITVEEGSSATLIDVLANDTDVDPGDTLTLVSVAYSGSGTAQVSDGKVSYTPGNNFDGSETIQYTARDSAGVESTATVNVTVTPKSSGGGSMSGLMFVLLLPLVALRRLRRIR